eukprot:1193367-Prorocentrum_minimum.AAC.5
MRITSDGGRFRRKTLMLLDTGFRRPTRDVSHKFQAATVNVLRCEGSSCTRSLFTCTITTRHLFVHPFVCGVLLPPVPELF